MDSYGKVKESGHYWPVRPFRWRYVVGLSICALGCFLLLSSVFEQIAAGNPRMGLALAGGGTAAAATALGALPVLLSQRFSQRLYDCFLGFGAGVMLAATAFSLIIPAIAAARGSGASSGVASISVGVGMLFGAALLIALNWLVRDMHSLEGRDDSDAQSLKRVWLFMLAVTLHNIPEGLAIGVAYAGIDVVRANTLTTGISIQDIPEGLVVALAFRGIGYRRLVSVGLGAASGLVEPVAAAMGVGLIGISAGLLPIGLAAAAGAMLFVIIHDVVPEFHLNGNCTFASSALVVGFVLMMLLDTALA